MNFLTKKKIVIYQFKKKFKLTIELRTQNESQVFIIRVFLIKTKIGFAWKISITNSEEYRPCRKVIFIFRFEYNPSLFYLLIQKLLVGNVIKIISTRCCGRVVKFRPVCYNTNTSFGAKKFVFFFTIGLRAVPPHYEF